MRVRWVAVAVLAVACATPPRPPRPEQQGLRPIEGAPIHGMGWRLWLPERPARLAVWLHPSRGSGEDLVEPMGPLFARHGFALLVPLKPEYFGWTSEDVRVLFGEVLPLVAKTPGVDATDPLIIGWSAGAQMSLYLWQTAPETVGAVVLVGSTPELLPGALPPRARVEGTAVLSIVGSEERGAQDWVNAVDRWKAHGVPLTLKIVPGRGHEWLFSERAERDFLETWLDAIAAP